MLTRSLKIGIVCPYSWETPGGVQNHIRDLAEFLISAGHEVSVLAPAADDGNLPSYVVNAGKPIAIPYNGAVARVLFGPVAFSRVRQWIANGDFDLLHLHEPAIPSISLLACWAADGPMIGTFHAASKRQKIIFAIGPILEPAIEKLSARIAVSEAARLTLTDHLDTDAVVIPNGIFASHYSQGTPQPQWQGNTIGFIGRYEEPRKGLSVLLEALPMIARFAPDVKVVVAGPGDPSEVQKSIDPQLRHRFTFLGKISEQDKANFMSSIAIYVAPNTGGESFGIILAEALAGGACVVASDIPAFDDLSVSELAELRTKIVEASASDTKIIATIDGLLEDAGFEIFDPQLRLKYEFTEGISFDNKGSKTLLAKINDLDITVDDFFDYMQARIGMVFDL